MPTGYTAKIADGISFNDFIMDCARAFGACISMRDEPNDKPIPEKFEASKWYKEKYEATQKELESLSKLSIETASTIANEDYEKAVASRQEGITKNDRLKERYYAMLGCAKQWQPPTPDHIELKSFMIKQIEDSVKFDCDNSYHLKNQPVLLSGEKWIEKRRAKLLKDLDYYFDENQKEIERNNGRNAWVKALRESLK